MRYPRSQFQEMPISDRVVVKMDQLSKGNVANDCIRTQMWPSKMDLKSPFMSCNNTVISCFLA